MSAMTTLRDAWIAGRDAAADWLEANGTAFPEIRALAPPAEPGAVEPAGAPAALEWTRTACGVDEHVADPHRGLALFADEGSGKTLVIQIHADGPGAKAEAQRIAHAAGLLTPPKGDGP